MTQQAAVTTETSRTREKWEKSGRKVRCENERRCRRFEAGEGGGVNRPASVCFSTSFTFSHLVLIILPPTPSPRHLPLTPPPGLRALMDTSKSQGCFLTSRLSQRRMVGLTQPLRSHGLITLAHAS
uniref:Uncharacterized protein n=1 Tax=Knipowitschia caucasica TaxID=637954 RepID=A0AAV2MEF3_KNICA